MSYYNPGSVVSALYRDNTVQTVKANTSTILKINGKEPTSFSNTSASSPMYNTTNNSIVLTNDGHAYIYLARLTFRFTPSSLQAALKLLTKVKDVTRISINVSLVNSNPESIIFGRTDILTGEANQQFGCTLTYLGDPAHTNALFFTDGANIRVNCEEAIAISDVQILISRFFKQ